MINTFISHSYCPTATLVAWPVSQSQNFHPNNPITTLSHHTHIHPDPLSKVKILQLGKFFPLQGGVEKVMYALMEGLSTRGINCDMLCAAKTGKGYVSKINDHANLICTTTLFKLKGTMISPSIVTTLRRKATEYDIIHVHHPDPMACLALWLSGFKGKVVVHWHSDIIKQRHLLKAYMPLQHWLLRRADAIVCTSRPYLEHSEHLKAWISKGRVVPIGIKPPQPDSFSVREIATRYKDRKLVFALGRLVSYKGFEYLIDAAKLLPSDYIIVIGGTGPLEKKLQTRIKRLGLEKKVQLLGWISNEKKTAYFGACDVFCLPSVSKTEAFGIVQIEAMAIGRPVITTEITGSGVPWVNAHGQSGLNVPIEDAQALADAISQICATPETLKRYSQGAKGRYLSHFTYDKMIDSISRIYLE